MHDNDKSEEIRLVIKWIFYLVLGAVIYISLKFINEREITLPQVGADLGEGTVKVTTKAIEEGAVVGMDVMEKSTYVTKDIITKGLGVTKQIIARNIAQKNNPHRGRPNMAARTRSITPAQQERHAEDDEEFQLEPRTYKQPLF